MRTVSTPRTCEARRSDQDSCTTLASQVDLRLRDFCGSHTADARSTLMPWERARSRTWWRSAILPIRPRSLRGAIRCLPSDKMMSQPYVRSSAAWSPGYDGRVALPPIVSVARSVRLVIAWRGSLQRWLRAVLQCRRGRGRGSRAVQVLASSQIVARAGPTSDRRCGTCFHPPCSHESFISVYPD